VTDDQILARYGEAPRSLVETTEPPEGYQPGCSNRHCLCWQPGAVCDEFMGQDESRYCPRCGWAHELHKPS
jgi:hypothetical protein